MSDPVTNPTAITKEKKSAYLVCEGAECICTFGSKSVKIKVDSHKKAYINGDKLVATEKDITFEKPTLPFTTCSQNTSNNNSCTPQFEKWLKPYKDIEVDGNAVITDKSELICLSFKGIVSIDTHGQTQDVNAAQAENMDRTIAIQINPMAHLIPLNTDTTKKVSVESITGELVETGIYKSVSTQEKGIIKSSKESNTDKDPTDIYVRPGQEIKFTATIVKGGVEALVCWKLKGSGEPKHFLQHGPTYQTSFSEIGTYSIEGYGTNSDSNLDVDICIVKNPKTNKLEPTARVEYTDCMLDILVQENTLIDIRYLQSNNIVEVTTKGLKEKAHIRIGVPATFEPVFTMPPIQKEIDELILTIIDASGTELKRTKGESKIIFEPKNSAAHYTIKAYYDGAEELAITYPVATSLNSVNVIATSNIKVENDRIRQNTFITFSVSKSKFMDDTVSQEIIEAENTQIKWYENSEILAGTGATYSKTYENEGIYRIVCNVAESQPGWFSKKKNGADDLTFEVTRNYPIAIEKKSTGISKTGRKISFGLKTIFEIDYGDGLSIHWILTGPEYIELKHVSTFEFTPQKKGTYKLYVSMNGREIKKPLEFECIGCEIEKGWWTDFDGNILSGNDNTNQPSNTIGVAGWGQEVVATFQHIGLGGETVSVEIWDKDTKTNEPLLKKDLTCTEGDNWMRCTLTLNDKMKSLVSSEGILYFKVTVKGGLIVINNGLAMPLKQLEYLKVDDSERAKAYFSDNNDTKRYSTASIDMPVYVQVKSTNLIGKELELVVYKSINLGFDKEYDEKIAFKVDTYGMASVKLDMCIFSDEFTDKDQSNNSILLYVKIFIKDDFFSTYSSDGIYILNLYKKLNTSPASSNTTKAFVMVDASKGEKNEAEEIVFPLLIKPENDLENKWGKVYYWAGKTTSNQATYNSNRSGSRKHAARDLYTNSFTTVVAICDGEILEVHDFYCLTHQITVKHKTNDGREFIVRYGELDPNSITIKTGDKIIQNQVLGKTGKLIKVDKDGKESPLMTLNGSIVFMLHFEYYLGSEGMNLIKPLTDRGNYPFQRRNDMKDPLPILLEGYNNTFEKNKNNTDRLSPDIFTTSKKGIEFILGWEKFKPLPYDDPKYCTIGYGHLIKRDLCKNITIPQEFKKGVSKEKALTLFKEDLIIFEKAVKREIKVKIHQNEFDALVSLLYNSGEYFLSTGGVNKGDTMIKKLINKQDYSGAATEFLDVTNKGVPGLVLRRIAEFNIFTNNTYDSTH